jgi:hypothetical protein
VADEEECLRRALGVRRGHTRGVGRKLKNITPDFTAPSFQACEDQRWQQQHVMNQQMQQQIFDLMTQFQSGASHQAAQFQGGASRHGSQRHEDEDDDDDDDEDDDDNDDNDDEET